MRVPVVERFSAGHAERLDEVMSKIHQGRPDPTLWERLAERFIADGNPLNIATKQTDALKLKTHPLFDVEPTSHRRARGAIPSPVSFYADFQLGA